MPDPIATIVAATDFSLFAHRAARRAGLLAKAHGATLQLLHVVDNSSFKSLLGQSRSPELEERLTRDTEAAIARGVFGVPTIFVGDEMFWGNDRFELVRFYVQKGRPERG